MKIFLCLVMAFVVCGCKLRQEQHGEEKWGGKVGKHLAKSADDFAVLNKKIDAFLGLKGAYKESDLDDIFNALKTSSKGYAKARRAVRSTIVAAFDEIDESVSKLRNLQDQVNDYGFTITPPKILKTEERVLYNKLRSAEDTLYRYDELLSKIHGHNPPMAVHYPDLVIDNIEVALRHEMVAEWKRVIDKVGKNDRGHLIVALENFKVDVVKGSGKELDGYSRMGAVQAVVIDSNKMDAPDVIKMGRLMKRHSY